MTGTEDFLTASLDHDNLKVDAEDPDPRPMIAVLDARPGLEDSFRARIVELVHEVRREPGFISAIPELSTGGPESLVQLDELPIDQPQHRPSRGRT
ncbi:hypothetical protein [Streptomyces hokutonensis]|uniref:hypothetical protein n=1 Tax=Streptomyces hokutonensis TaxID=1306990 RepID=UPI0038199CA3